jgi:uncharacterized RDD family membrane protein YckC
MSAPLPRPAGLLRRLGAMLYDALIVVALWMTTAWPIVITLHDSPMMRPLLQSVLFIELFAFFAYFWVWRGQTIGMLAWHLRVESDDGAPLRLGQALLRFVGALLSFGTLGIGYLWMYIDPDRRTWPDMLSRTHVVHLQHARPG